MDPCVLHRIGILINAAGITSIFRISTALERLHAYDSPICFKNRLDEVTVNGERLEVGRVQIPHIVSSFYFISNYAAATLYFDSCLHSEVEALSRFYEVYYVNKFDTSALVSSVLMVALRFSLGFPLRTSRLFYQLARSGFFDACT